MKREKTDVAVVGGGIAGMITTACLAAEGFEVICIEPNAATPDADAPGADLRSTAFLEPSVALFRRADLWPVLEPFATDLRVMRLCDAGGAENGVRERADFRADELGTARWGVNLPNWRIRKCLADALSAHPGVRFMTGQKVARITPRTAHALLTLEDGTQIETPLAIACDGRDSPLRAAAGIGARTWEYGQKAMVFAVSHPEPHDFVSTEIHRSGGPFTTVPLPDQNGVPHSAVVWMERDREVAELMALDAAAFARAATERSCHILGPLELATPRGAWPIISRIADRMDGPRIALLAEAAHVMPPIGAQGLNTSLADTECLLDLLGEARARGADIGAPGLLSAYNRARHGDALARVLGVHALNTAAMADAQGLRDLRRAGLKLLATTRPLRQAAMRSGLGSARQYAG